MVSSYHNTCFQILYDMIIAVHHVLLHLCIYFVILSTQINNRILTYCTALVQLREVQWISMER